MPCSISYSVGASARSTPSTAVAVETSVVGSAAAKQ
jgi:hypothetical protein